MSCINWHSWSQLLTCSCRWATVASLRSRLLHPWHCAICSMYHWCVPEDVSDTSFRGHTFVVNKDKVTQPSNALRHSTELTDLIRIHFQWRWAYLDLYGLTSAQPIAVVVSDGGPDHRVTFGPVQVVGLIMFRALDLDMLVCVRTCPYQPLPNAVGCIAWTSMLKQLVKKKNSPSEAIKMYPELHGALQDSSAGAVGPMIVAHCVWPRNANSEHFSNS